MSAPVAIYLADFLFGFLIQNYLDTNHTRPNWNRSVIKYSTIVILKCLYLLEKKFNWYNPTQLLNILVSLPFLCSKAFFNEFPSVNYNIKHCCHTSFSLIDKQSLGNKAEFYFSSECRYQRNIYHGVLSWKFSLRQILGGSWFTTFISVCLIKSN